MIEIGGTCEFGTVTLSYFSVMMFWCAGHGGWLTDGAISMSGSQAVTSSGDELAVVWDLHQGNCLNVLEGHSGEVRSVVLTRRGRCATVLQSSLLKVLVASSSFSVSGRIAPVSLDADRLFACVQVCCDWVSGWHSARVGLARKRRPCAACTQRPRHWAGHARLLRCLLRCILPTPMTTRHL